MGTLRRRHGQQLLTDLLILRAILISIVFRQELTPNLCFPPDSCLVPWSKQKVEEIQLALFCK